MKKKPEALPLDRGVRWTPELRAEVWSTRGAVNPEFEREDLEQMGDVRGRWKERRHQIGLDFPRTKKWFLTGLGRVDPAVRPMMEATLAAAAETKMPDGPLDLDAEVGLVALEIVAVFYSLELWVAKEGLPFALRALAKCHEYGSSGDEYFYTDAGVWLMHDRTRSHRRPEYADSAWRQLRAALAVADDATYASARAVATEIRPSAPPAVRALLAIAFATERSWADEAADETLALASSRAGWAKALVTVASVDRCERLARVKEWGFAEHELLTLMAREGGASAPVLVAALESAGNNDERKRYAKVLAMIETEEVARAFVPWMSNRTVSPIALRFYKRAPELARRTLEPLASGKTLEAKQAALALASIR